MRGRLCGTEQVGGEQVEYCPAAFRVTSAGSSSARVAVTGGEARAVRMGFVTHFDRPLTPAVPTTGTLVLRSNVTGDMAYVDGRRLGPTPQRLEVEPGVHRVRVEVAGRLPWEGEARVEAGQTATLWARFDAALRVHSSSGVRLVRIPAGSFTMGCSEGDTACDDDERPAHRVVISRPFEMAETETTNAQYRRCVEAESCLPPGDRRAYDDSSKAEHPVVMVSWEDAAAFCRWVAGRLPTEAEWEYAARGGREAARYPWGDAVPVCSAGSSNSARFYDSRCQGIRTVAVATYGANGYGLYDLAGNVWEWMADWYEGGYYSRSPSKDPSGPPSGTLRVLRGGSWNFTPRDLRVSSRIRYEPDRRSFNYGFRCARTMSSP